jgi:restriction system protein
MARRHYRRRRQDNSLAGPLLFVGGIVVAGLYTKLSAQELSFAIGVALVLAITTVALVLFVYYKRTEHEKQKLRALTTTDIDAMEGVAFEKYVAALLKQQGYTKVALTERYDLGIDIVALKNDVRWGVQVKRYSYVVRAAAVRQVVTALNNYHCQRSMVVTNSTFSRPAKILAETNDCVLVDRDTLAEWIIAFQNNR